MIRLFSSLWSARNLLFNLVRRDLTVRYKSTFMGFFWSFAKPLAYMGIYYLIFGQIFQMRLKQEGVPYALHVLTAVIPWTFFVGASSEAMTSVLSSANLVKKVKLPLVVFPVAATLSHAVHFALAMLVVVVGMLLMDLYPGPLFLLLPLIVLLQWLLILSVGMMLAALNVFFRDIASIWEVVAAAWFYATPIIYPAYRATDYLGEREPVWLATLYLLNPMTPIVLAYRRVMLYGSLGPESEGSAGLKLEISDSSLIGSIAVITVATLCALWLSHEVYRRLSRRFADVL